jgi:hypothetical protein
MKAARRRGVVSKKAQMRLLERERRRAAVQVTQTASMVSS